MSFSYSYTFNLDYFAPNNLEFIPNNEILYGDGSFNFEVKISECVPFISGCMDSNACNFNPDAGIPSDCDFSCYYGCMNDQACNYDPNVIYEDGSCEFNICGVFEIYGCTDSSACNYDFYSNVDNGTCGITIIAVPVGSHFVMIMIQIIPYLITEDECDENYNGVWFSNDCDDSSICISSNIDPLWNSDCPPEIISILPDSSAADETLTVTISGNYVDYSNSEFYFVQWTDTNNGFNSWTDTNNGFNSWTDTNNGFNSWTDTNNGFNSWTNTNNGFNSWTDTNNGFNSWTNTNNGFNSWTNNNNGFNSWTDTNNGFNSWTNTNNGFNSWNDTITSSNSFFRNFKLRRKLVLWRA